MNTKEQHACRWSPGTEILKGDDGVWQLYTYAPMSRQDLEFGPSPISIAKDADWKTIGFWNMSNYSALVIRYCPWCGTKLLGNEEFYENWEQRD